MKFPTLAVLLLAGSGLALPVAAMDLGTSSGGTATTAGSTAGSSGNTTSEAGGEDERNAGDETRPSDKNRDAKAKRQEKRVRRGEERKDDAVDSAAGKPGSTGDQLGVDVDARATGGAETESERSDRRRE